MASNTTETNICYFAKFAKAFTSAPRCCACMCKFFASVFATYFSAGLPQLHPWPEGSNQQVVQQARLNVKHVEPAGMCFPVLWIALDCPGFLCFAYGP